MECSHALRTFVWYYASSGLFCFCSTLNSVASSGTSDAPSTAEPGDTIQHDWFITFQDNGRRFPAQLEKLDNGLIQVNASCSLSPPTFRSPARFEAQVLFTFSVILSHPAMLRFQEVVTDQGTNSPSSPSNYRTTIEALRTMESMKPGRVERTMNAAGQHLKVLLSLPPV